MAAEESKTHLKFCIMDNGIRKDKNQHDKIFLIFLRLHHSDEFEGAGLGLAYYRNIIELNDGKIWIDLVIMQAATSILRWKSKHNG
jgi:light-regulated signal transduction histidine kinase (bacteriophytochrome)